MTGQTTARGAGGAEKEYVKGTCSTNASRYGLTYVSPNGVVVKEGVENGDVYQIEKNTIFAAIGGPKVLGDIRWLGGEPALYDLYEATGDFEINFGEIS